MTREVRLSDVADVSWGDTSTTKAKYVTTGERHTAFSASGPDGFLPYCDFDRTGVVLSAIGANAGKTWLATGRWSCIKNTIRFFSHDESIADTRFLYWATRQDGTWPLRGSAQPFISQADARSISLSLPPISDQRAVAALLGAFDDKIESNQRIQTLALALASAEFDRALESAGSTRLADIATIVLGGTPSKSEAAFWGGREIAWINSGAANEEIILRPTEFITPLALQKSAAKLMPHGATVLAITGATLGQVALLGIETAGNQSLVGIWGDSSEKNTWIHFAIQARIDDLLSYATGAAQQHVNKQNVEDLIVPTISPGELTTWGRKVVPLVELAVSVATESLKLVALREALLPELLSGRIKTDEVAV